MKAGGHPSQPHRSEVVSDAREAPVARHGAVKGHGHILDELDVQPALAVARLNQLFERFECPALDGLAVYLRTECRAPAGCITPTAW